MNPRKPPFLLKSAALICALMLAGGMSAQTFTTLHSFTTGSDGSSPFDGLVLNGKTLYGTTYLEASDSGGVVRGTVFAMSTNGTSFTNLHTFPPFTGTNNNPDGNGPISGPTLSGGRLYGTSVLGGTWGEGTVFALNPDGTGFTVLHNFNSTNDGTGVHGRLVVIGDAIIGTAISGGSSNQGTVFTLSTNGSRFTVLHTFTEGNEGSEPYGALILSGPTLYGTAAFGAGAAPVVSGTIFSLNVDGGGFKILHTFPSTITDGARPLAGLTISGTNLYGVTSYGGTSGSGTVFAMNTDGTGFTNLYNFTAIPRGPPPAPPRTNSDGAFPQGELILAHNTLYGSTGAGGTGANGTVFAVHTDGTGFTVLHTFTGNGDGSQPNGHLVVSGNTLYGTESSLTTGYGSVFSISFSPQLAITTTGSSVILSWPTNYAGFDYTGYTLQSTMDLGSPAWTTNLPAPVVINGQYAVSNSFSSKQQFFRLTK